MKTLTYLLLSTNRYRSLPTIVVAGAHPMVTTLFYYQ